LYKMNQIWY